MTGSFSNRIREQLPSIIDHAVGPDLGSDHLPILACVSTSRKEARASE